MAVIRNPRAWFEFVNFSPNASAQENVTIDVANKGCFGSFDTVACVRNGLLSLFILVTFLLCLGRIIKLHLVKHPQIHQYFIFYFAALECILWNQSRCFRPFCKDCANSRGVNWIIGNHLPQIDFSASYLKLLQFIVICHLHWTLATRILHKERLVSRIIVPILVMYFGYFTTITILGILTVKSSWTECLEPEWLLLSSMEFLVVQLFMIAGIYITKKINTVSTVDAFKRAQKRDLWSVIAAYEISALVSVTYDVTMLTLGIQRQSCSAVFGHVQLLYSSIFALFMMFKFMLPIWTMLCVFHPVQVTVVDPETVLGWSFDGQNSSTSVFSPANREHSIYKQLQHPGSDSLITTPNGSEIFVRQPSTQIARSHTAPASFFSGFLRRTHSAGLTPITEEDNSSHTTTTCTDKGSLPDKEIADEQPLLRSSSSRTEPSNVSE